MDFMNLGSPERVNSEVELQIFQVVYFADGEKTIKNVIVRVIVRRWILTYYRTINPHDSRRGEAESGMEWVYGPIAD